MSSTNRGSERMEHDYYATPVPEIVKFLRAWREDKITMPERVLDPCAGGNEHSVGWTFKKGKNGQPDEVMTVPPTRMSYPAAFDQVSGWLPEVFTNDIRTDSPAQMHEDFRVMMPPKDIDAVISNPPFSLAMEFIQRGLEIVRDNGHVVMLLRANFFGSDTRHRWFQKNMPQFIYFHANRMSFTPNGKKDSVEYVHAVWQKGLTPRESKFRILDY